MGGAGIDGDEDEVGDEEAARGGAMGWKQKWMREVNHAGRKSDYERVYNFVGYLRKRSRDELIGDYFKMEPRTSGHRDTPG